MAALHPIPPFDELTYYPTSRWIRGTRGGVTVIDSRSAALVWEPGEGAATRSPLPMSRSPRPTGPRPGSAHLRRPDLAGYVAVTWDAVEHWYEEEEEVFVHPRDPFVR